MNRFLDLGVAVLAAIVMAPVIAVTALMVRLFLGSPVLFDQQRAGLHGKIFTIYKFRSMRDGPESDDERLGRFGKLLRATSLDEAPQIWNILRGDMAVVGPRPLLPRYLPRYSARHAHRHDVKPGITGWSQVTGRNAFTWEEQFEADLWYVEHRSLALDLRILLMTVGKVLSRRGVAAPGRATRGEFMGYEP